MKKEITTEKDMCEKAVCLVSGGIDSPVAAWLAIKKGLTPVFVYFDNSPLTDETTEQRAIEAVRKLRRYLPNRNAELHVVPHGADLVDILKSCRRNLTCVLCRRMMYRIAERIAVQEGAEAVVTGEIIGEHASQTLTNLRVENQAVSKVTMLRPLAGYDKIEVIAKARRIGTFDASTKPASCCVGPPSMPRTRARFEEVLEAEQSLNLENMIQRALKGIRVINV